MDGINQMRAAEHNPEPRHQDQINTMNYASGTNSTNSARTNLFTMSNCNSTNQSPPAALRLSAKCPTNPWSCVVAGEELNFGSSSPRLYAPMILSALLLEANCDEGSKDRLMGREDCGGERDRGGGKQGEGLLGLGQLLDRQDDEVIVLESEKRAWENSPEAQAVKEALNPWRGHDSKVKENA
ncbi:hypothetical protein Droror1_Dr00015134 [Drosera rotundifolia]